MTFISFDGRQLKGDLPGKVLKALPSSIEQVLDVDYIIGLNELHLLLKGKMSTVNLGHDLALEEDTRNLSLVESVKVGESAPLLIEQTLGLKSETQFKKESEARQKKVNDLTTLAEKTNLCFLVDCTGSMTPWINEVKKNIKIWSEGLHEKHTNMELHVAFVRYTDHDQPKDTQTTWIDFKTNLDKFYHFVDRISTPDGVGDDTAEDVFGGLDAMLKLSWPPTGTKVLIHIADAPCHGTQYHDLPKKSQDLYPNGDPAGLQLDDLMKQLAQKDIMYYFGYIKKESTNKMIKAFNASLQTQSKKIHSIQQFDVSDPTSLLEGVFRSVTCSITATLDVLVSEGTRFPRDYTIDKNIPDWDTLKPQQVMVNPPPTIGSAPKREIPQQPLQVKIAPQPFAEGGQKLVYHAYNVDAKEHIVLKQSKWMDPRSNSIKRCLETAQVHAIAANFSAEFNRETTVRVDTIPIEFTSVGVMLVPDADGSQPQYLTYEPYIMKLSSSSYTKFNSNFDYVLSTGDHHEDPIYNDSCQAFSHYTWVKSGRRLVVCDLQGVKSRFKLILTDPAIHYINILCHGSTNLGMKGIQMFFQVHKCNNICRALKLDKQLPEQQSVAAPTTSTMPITHTPTSLTPTPPSTPPIPTTPTMGERKTEEHSF